MCVTSVQLNFLLKFQVGILGDVILLSRSINVLNISPSNFGCCPVVILVHAVVSDTLFRLFMIKSTAMAFKLVASYI